MKDNGENIDDMDLKLDMMIEEMEFTPIVEKPEEWTVVSALSYLLTLSRQSGLKKSFWAEAREALDYVTPILGLTDIQTLVITLLVEEGDSMSWKRMGDHFGCTRLQMMAWSDEMDELVTKGWICRYASRERGRLYEGFKAAYGVATALRHNKRFEPENLSGFTIQQFIDRLSSRVDANMDNPNIRLDDDIEWMLQLVNANPGLELCQHVKRMKDKYEKALLLLVVADYALWADSPNEGLQFAIIHNIFPEDHEAGGIRHKLRDGSHRLILNHYIEYACEEGIVDTECFRLHQSVKDIMLSEYRPSRLRCGSPKTNDRMLQSHTSIAQKTLYYNETERQQLTRLSALLMPGNFEGVRNRLAEKGMRQGFACIFYGSPGTGKTETVLQLARLTGRDIMRIEVAGLRDKWVGQSEKNIKSIFMRYKELCKNRDTAPILFFNEADAIFGRRHENAEHSVDKMNNAIQNIILQEIEDLDGILIATTNLCGALDPAFERRFLFKVEFTRPSVEVKGNIWKSMLGESITADEALQLADSFDFCGGEIENIVRKQTIEYVLEGEQPTFAKLLDLCNEELIKLRSRRCVGFSS